MAKRDNKAIKFYPSDITVMRCVLCGHTFVATSKTCGCPLCIGEVVRVYSK